jgi:putative SOS response-associated peptidase YedK
MCGRYMVTTPPEAMRRLFGTQGVLPNFPPRYNVAPTQDVPMVFVDGENRALALMRWGLVPAGSEADRNGKPRPGKAPLINARSESAATAAPFKRAFAQRRCLVPANGYFEWEKATSRQRRASGARTPHLFRPGDGDLIAFAGVWEEWVDPARPKSPPLRTCAILTTRASPLVAPLHDRMPVILASATWPVWLGEAKVDHAALQGLLRSGGDAGFTDTIVSKRVNSHVNDDPACIEPAPPETPAPRDRLF